MSTGPLPVTSYEFIRQHLACQGGGPPHTLVTEYPDDVAVEMIECTGCYAQWLRVITDYRAPCPCADDPQLVDGMARVEAAETRRV